jgi:hypothetical protein
MDQRVSKELMGSNLMGRTRANGDSVDKIGNNSKLPDSVNGTGKQADSDLVGVDAIDCNW